MNKTLIKLESINKIFLIVFGSFLMSLGTYFFNVPLNIAPGGVTGFSQVISYLFPAVNLGLLIMVLNIILLLIGYRYLGKEFGIYTIIGSFSFSIIVTIYEFIIEVTEPLLQDTLANVIVGAVLTGVGLAMVLRQNASTGGTDVIAKIFEKYLDINISQAMLMVDTIVIIFATFVFGLQQGIYAFISIYITTFVVGKTIAGFNTKIQMTIISDHIDDINNFIQKEIVRGTTFYKAAGGYTRAPKEILVTVVDKKQYIKIRNYINSIDPDSFVYISSINEVIGFGFSRELKLNVPTRENTEIKD